MLTKPTTLSWRKSNSASLHQTQSGSIDTGNVVSSSPVTLYYRLYCFSPSDKNLESEPTNKSVDNFMLNTDFNYTKLALADVFDQAANMSFTPTFQVVSHNLGYLPQVSYWVESGGFIRSSAITSPTDTGVTCNVTSTTLTFSFINTQASRVHYRIYHDE